MRKNKIRIILLSAFAILFLVLGIWVVWSNKALELNTYTIESNQLPAAFDGFRIAQISDIHNAQIG